MLDDGRLEGGLGLLFVSAGRFIHDHEFVFKIVNNNAVKIRK
jgi:hypothetical protein